MFVSGMRGAYQPIQERQAAGRDAAAERKAASTGQSATERAGGRFSKAAGLTLEMAGPEGTANAIQQIYKLLAASPAFANIIRSSMAQGSQGNTAIQGALAKTGLGSSGVGAIMGGLGTQLAGNAALGARAGLFDIASQQGGDIMSRIAALYPELTKQSHRNYGRRSFSVGGIGVGGGPS